MRSAASSSAARSSGAHARRRRRRSPRPRRRGSRASARSRSQRSVSSMTAASPRAATSARIAATSASTSASASRFCARRAAKRGSKSGLAGVEKLRHPARLLRRGLAARRRLKPGAALKRARNRPATVSSGFGEEGGEGGRGRRGRLLGEVVAGGQRVAAHVGGLLAPGREDVVGPPDDAAVAPEREERGGDAPGGVGGVVVEVDRGRGAVVLAGGRDRCRIREAAEVFGDGLRREEACLARAPRRELGAEVELGIGARSAARGAAPAGSGRTSGSRRARRPCRSARTSSRSGRCRAPPAGEPRPGGRAPSGARPARRGRGRRRRSVRSRGRA